jgi:thiol-disulfide isomerase/thioredoxin
VKTGLLVLALLSAPAFADSPPIEVAIDSAARDGKRLILEFGAEWCKPCREFEQTVLVDPTVIAALQKVSFIRYDVDTPIGLEAAERYEVASYPTFLVVDAKGEVKFRSRGVQPGRAAIAWFLQLVRTGTSDISPIEKLRAAVTANPDDVASRLALGRALREAGDTQAALEQLRAVSEHPQATRLDAAEAEAAIEELEAAAHRIEALLASATLFVDRNPSSPVASHRLALLVLARRGRREDLERSIATHLAAVRPIDRPDALRVALLAGKVAQARAALDTWSDGDRRHTSLMAAEILLYEKKPRDALRLVDATCNATATGIEAWCLDLYNVLRSAGTQSIGLMRIQTRAQAILEDLARPGGAAARVFPAIPDAIARAVLEVDRKCSAFAGTTARVMLQIERAPAGGMPRGVQVTPGDNLDLARCVRETIARVKLPALTALDQPTAQAYLFFGSAQVRRRRGMSNARYANGVSVATENRWGAIDTAGLAIDSLIDLGAIPQFRLLGSVQLAGGIVDGDPSYAGRALLGVGLVQGRGSLALQVGVGGSDYGDLAPRAFELPVVLRLRAQVRLFHLHAWARGSYMFAAAREPATTFGLAAADEMALGASVSIPYRWGTRIVVGIEYEDRAAGRGGVFSAGISTGYF